MRQSNGHILRDMHSEVFSREVLLLSYSIILTYWLIEIRLSIQNAELKLKERGHNNGVQFLLDTFKFLFLKTD